MNTLENALLEAVEIFDQNRIPYMIIGGLANVVWGLARATLDIDVTVWVREKDIEELVKRLAKTFTPVPLQPLDFIRDTRVLPLDSRDGARVDVIFGVSPFEEHAIQRAVKIAVSGAPVNFCTAEDLILLKMISDRPKDQHDAREIIQCQRGKIDLVYLEPYLKNFAAALNKPHLWERWQKWKQT